MNINSQNVSKAEEQLELARKDLVAFGKLFLPDDFMRSETPFFHYEVTDALMDKKYRQLAIILPRGHGKTVLTKANIMHDFCFATSPLFYGWVAASSKISVPNLDYVKYHIEYNDKVQYYFGNLKGKKWTEDDIELSDTISLCWMILKMRIILSPQNPERRSRILSQLWYFQLSNLKTAGLELMAHLFTLIRLYRISLLGTRKQISKKKSSAGK